ncbi:unnamed protein product, partial [Candidula unifasciata]
TLSVPQVPAISTTTTALPYSSTICRQNPQLVLTKRDNCAQFYNCSRPNSLLGSFVDECPVGELFHSTKRQCLSHQEVVCQGRYEPKQVCKLLVTLNIFCLNYFRCGPQDIGVEFSGVTFKMEECPYPLLFSNGLCHSYKTLRKCSENVSRCIVDSADTCPDNPQHTCIPCELRYPSCLGAPDGLMHYPGRLFTPDFINCDQGRTLSILKCVRSVFDPDARRCGLKLETVVTEAQRNTVSFCRKYPQAIIPHPTHCGQFFNCSHPAERGLQGKPHLQECRYLRLFDSNVRSCENFIKVLKTTGCGTKFQPKHYCDQASVCPSPQFPTCDQCRKALPSCENQTNGIHGNPPGGGITRGFMYCVEGRVLATSLCSSGTMYHESKKLCLASSQSPGRR